MSLSRRTLLSTSMLAPMAGVSANTVPRVRTDYGPVEGTTEDDVLVFKGIPYGADTGGANRFLPARAPVPWQEPLQTTEYGAAAPQPPSPLFRNENTSEDCLVLNVWTPGLQVQAKRPVMVWLHGGGFSTLSGSSPVYDGVRLAQTEDVVVVTLNHRLNALGYLHLGDFDRRFESSGNQGMLDIVQALLWVRDHIRRFGGDPRNVTIFGESGGGRKVSTLMGMPGAVGLFHRAIIQSGPGVRLQPRDKARETALAFLDHLNVGVNELERLQQLPVDTLMEAFSAVEQGFDEGRRARGRFEQRGFVPTVGIPSLPDYVFDPVASRLSKNVPLLIGTNRDEMALFYRNDPKVVERTLTFAELDRRVRALVGNAAERVLAVYRRLYPDLSAAEIWVRLVSDRTYRHDSIMLAERKADLGPAVYLYHFAFPSPVAPVLGAHHALEIPFVFDNLDKNPWSGTGPAAQKLAVAMRSAWAQFARGGAPASPGLPAWERFHARDRKTMILAAEPRLATDPDAATRRLWATV